MSSVRSRRPSDRSNPRLGGPPRIKLNDYNLMKSNFLRENNSLAKKQGTNKNKKVIHLRTDLENNYQLIGFSSHTPTPKEDKHTDNSFIMCSFYTNGCTRK